MKLCQQKALFREISHSHYWVLSRQLEGRTLIWIWIGLVMLAGEQNVQRTVYSSRGRLSTCVDGRRRLLGEYSILKPQLI